MQFKFLTTSYIIIVSFSIKKGNFWLCHCIIVTYDLVLNMCSTFFFFCKIYLLNFAEYKIKLIQSLLINLDL